MGDRPLILAGLTLFVGLVTNPIWHGALDRKAALAAPSVKLPAQEKQCVAPMSYMRSSHMKLLEGWRDEAVRDGQRQFVAFNGKTYDNICPWTGEVIGQASDASADDVNAAIAAARRVSTRARDMRQAPMAIKTASTTGNSSGNIDMPSAMPPSTASSQPPRNVP